jgi:2-haloacid dehalogenase
MKMEEMNGTNPELILFDVYQTLLDMSELEKRVNGLLDSKRGYQLWDAWLMQYCFANNALDHHTGFLSLAGATLEMAGKYFGRTIRSSDIDDIVLLFQQLPVQEGVQEGLSLLHQQGYRIAALTNVPAATVIPRMERTGLVSYFEEVMSAESIKKYKPAREVYDWAAKKLEIRNEDILMVTTHGWDIAGAANAGMQTAYLKQGRVIHFPLAPEPQIISSNLPDLAGQLEKKVKSL